MLLLACAFAVCAELKHYIISPGAAFNPLLLFQPLAWMCTSVCVSVLVCEWEMHVRVYFFVVLALLPRHKGIIILYRSESGAYIRSIDIHRVSTSDNNV